MMDAREKWLERGDALLVEAINAQYHLGQISGGSCVTMQQAIPSELAFDAIRAYLRTTPEGFALVPVPEWVPVGERLPVVPEGESMINVWYAYKDFVGACPISRDGAWSLPSHATHWQHNYEPAPPKSESL